MNAEELQRWASILRWVGLSVTAVGLLITFGSHYIADKLIVVQRADKAVAQERLKQSEAELQATKAKTAELELRQKPREVTKEQRDKLRSFLASASSKPAFSFRYTSGDKEAEGFARQLSAIFAEAGFQNSCDWRVGAPLPIGLTVLSRSEATDANASVLANAFKMASIPIHTARSQGAEALAKDIQVFVGTKP